MRDMNTWDRSRDDQTPKSVWLTSSHPAYFTNAQAGDGTSGSKKERYEYTH